MGIYTDQNKTKTEASHQPLQPELEERPSHQKLERDVSARLLYMLFQKWFA